MVRVTSMERASSINRRASRVGTFRNLTKGTFNQVTRLYENRLLLFVKKDEDKRSEQRAILR